MCALTAASISPRSILLPFELADLTGYPTTEAGIAVMGPLCWAAFPAVPRRWSLPRNLGNLRPSSTTVRVFSL
jgi:hypothetical protein